MSISQNDTYTNLSQKDAFLKCLENMDLIMLDEVLDDSITYFGASKKVFLNKLGYIFNKVHLGGGAAPLEIYRHRKRSDTYYLKLIIFSYANKFVIDERDGKIINIYNPRENFSREYVENVYSLNIFFGIDERPEFKPTIDYLKNLNKCSLAYQELVNDNVEILSAKEIYLWLTKHQNFYISIKDDYLYFNYKKFLNLYFILEDLIDKLRFHYAAVEALTLFENNNISIQKWLIKYYRIAFYEVFHFESDFSDIDYDNKTLRHYFHPRIRLSGEHFFTILKFNEIYHQYYEVFKDEIE